MKFKPIAFLKSLNWSKDDIKKVLMLITMLTIACLILNNFLLVRIKIIQKGWGDSLSIDGSINADADISGSVDADVSGSIYSTIDGSIDVDGEITAEDPIGGFDVNVR